MNVGSAILSMMLAQPSLPEAVSAIHADLARMPMELRSQMRYLVRPQSWDDKTWDLYRPVLSGHCNQLSRSAIVERPTRVGAVAVRVNLSDYGWTRELWDRLQDPYTTIPVREALKVSTDEWVPFEGGIWAGDGKRYAKGAFLVRATRVVERGRTYALAPWLHNSPEGKTKLGDIVNWTQSKAPMVRADWFFNQTSAQQARDVGYYDFLGIKTEDEAFKLVGFDKKLAEGFRFELRESVSESGVTHNPRGIARFDTLGGGIWRSIDFKRDTLNKLREKGVNPTKLPGRELENFADGFEVFGALPNGMPVTWAANNKKVLLDAVPGDIAGDTMSRSTNKQVEPGWICLRCHGNKGEGCLKDIDEWFRNSLNPPLELRFYDYDKAREIRQQYLRKLQPALVRDRVAYELAIIEATGIKSDEYLKRYTALAEMVEDAKVGTEYVAADWGMTAKELRERILKAIKGGYSGDLAADVFVHEGKKARFLRIRDYWDVIPALQATLRASK